MQYLEAISGGEKTLAALSLIFAIQDLLAEELLKGSLADTEVVEIRVKEDKPYIKPVKKKEKLEAIFNQ